MNEALAQRIAKEMQELEKIPQSYDRNKEKAKIVWSEIKSNINFDDRIIPWQEKQKILEELVNYNESFYCGPAQPAVELTRRAIGEARAGKTQEAWALFAEACDNFDHPALLFNLGKFLLELGEPDGLVHLLIYTLNQTRQDWYTAELLSRFEITADYPVYYGKFGEYAFEIRLASEHGEVEEIRIQPELTGLRLELPFKIPLCLNLEPHTNAEPGPENYNYVHELIGTEPEITELEVKIPLLLWQRFLEEFEGVMIDLSVSYEAVCDFESAFWQEVSSPKYIPPEEQSGEYREPLLSAVRLKLRTEKSHTFIQTFGEFLMINTGRFLADEEIGTERMGQPEEPPETFFILDEYERFYAFSEQKYALLSGCLYNVEHGAINPFLHTRNKGYEDGRKKYRRMFTSIAHLLEPETSPPSVKEIFQQHLAQVCGKLKRRELAVRLETEIQYILNLIHHQPVSTLQHMRKALEILVKEVYYKINHVPEHNTLASIIYEVNRRHNKQEINRHMSEIRILANKYLHYDTSQFKSDLGVRPQISREEVCRLLDGLFVVMHFFADVYYL